VSVLKGVKNEVLVTVTAELLGDFGKKTKVTFKVRYRKLNHTDAQTLLDRLKGEEVTEEEVLRANVLGWSDLVGNDDQNVPFSDEAFAEMLEAQGYRRALVSGFMKQQYEVDLKNP